MKKWSVLFGTIFLIVSTVTAGAFGGAKIVNGSGVKLIYSLAADGKPIVSDKKREGMELVVGKGAYPPDFEKQLLGMKKGETKNVKLTPQQAFGPYRSELVKKIPLSAIPKGLNLREGQVLGGKNGQRVVRIVKILPDAVVMDQNHPLAGKTLLYRIEVEKLS